MSTRHARARVVAIAALVVAALTVSVAGPEAPHGGALTSPSCGGEAPGNLGDTQWACSFDDEFSGDSLDSSNWMVQQTATSGFTTGPVGASVCYVNSPSTVAVTGGALRLSVRQESSPFFCGARGVGAITRYIGGEVLSYGRLDQTYGEFEVRAKVPATRVSGLHEALWLWPDNARAYGGWPSSGEVDFAEFFSQAADLDIPYIHYNPRTTPTDTIGSGPNQVTADDCTINRGAYNVYRLIWLPGLMRVTVNGTRCLVDHYSAQGLSGAAPFDKPFFLVLTQALATNTGAFQPGITPLPATTSVDYVRVWRAVP